jgi:hypothetical protein
MTEPTAVTRGVPHRDRGIESDPRGSNLEAIFVGSVSFEVVRNAPARSRSGIEHRGGLPRPAKPASGSGSLAVAGRGLARGDRRGLDAPEPG